MPDLRTVLTETLREHQWSFIKHGCRCGDPGTVNEWPAHAADALLGLPGVAVVDAEVYRVARKGLVDLTEACAELSMDTPEDQSLHDRLVTLSRVAADLLPLPKVAD
ncbi:MAG: hypothetical protein ABFE07_09740 [Armatimonadia bacterium]